MDVGEILYLSVNGAQDDDSQVGLISYCCSASGHWILQSLEVNNQMRW